MKQQKVFSSVQQTFFSSPAYFHCTHCVFVSFVVKINNNHHTWTHTEDCRAPQNIAVEIDSDTGLLKMVAAVRPGDIDMVPVSVFT